MTPATEEQVIEAAETAVALVEQAQSELIDRLQAELANALEWSNQLIAQKEMAEGKLAKAESQRDGLRNLLELARQSMRDCIDNRDGRDDHDMGCGNCIAGVPLAHSLGCRIDAALRGLR